MGSVPSATISSPNLKSSSDALTASFSKAITPSFLAFVANPTISVIRPSMSTLGGINTSLNNATASFKTSGGKLNTTAPEVPPSTINAAVI